MFFVFFRGVRVLTPSEVRPYTSMSVSFVLFCFYSCSFSFQVRELEELKQHYGNLDHLIQEQLTYAENLKVMCQRLCVQYRSTTYVSKSLKQFLLMCMLNFLCYSLMLKLVLSRKSKDKWTKEKKAIKLELSHDTWRRKEILGMVSLEIWYLGVVNGIIKP